jgi:hypothetical protein
MNSSLNSVDSSLKEAQNTNRLLHQEDSVLVDGLSSYVSVQSMPMLKREPMDSSRKDESAELS